MRGRRVGARERRGRRRDMMEVRGGGLVGELLRIRGGTKQQGC